MKVKNFILLMTFLIGFGFIVKADKIEENEARLIAKNYFYEKVNQFGEPLNYNDIVIKNLFIKEHNGQTMLYAFDFKGGGFVIISAETAYYPVIGYSLQGAFPSSASSESNYGSFIASYCEQISWLRKNNIEVKDAIQNEWDHLLVNDISLLKTERSGRSLEPLVNNLWNQDSPYNIYAPEDADGPGGHCYAGCVATAMSMIMYYWRYPETGTGSHSYYCPGYGQQSADFENTEYMYTGMQDEITNQNPWDIALLQYHCGVAVNMDYGPDGSSSYSSIVASKLRSFFRYDDAIYRQKTGSNDYWANELKYDLDQGIPIYYAGTTTTEGHAFVCDGYDDNNFFHFNFGWSGNGNGYYALNDVGGWYRNQRVVMSFYPTDPDYPYYAEGSHTITTLAGSITDGSGPVEDYINNQSASWLIDPQSEEDSVKSVTISFPRFDLAANDQLIVYDGPSTSYPVLGSYSGSNPAIDDITSTGNQVLITFETNNSETDKGFYIEYKANLPEFCSGLVKYYESTGIITDGSGSFNYSNNSGCMYQITPEYASEITLTFTEFDTEEGKDKVMVYDGSSTLLGTFSGNEIPGPFTSTSGSMMIIFNSNPFVNAPGWKAEYSINNVGMEKNKDFDGLSIYPNPAKDNIQIQFKNTDSKEIRFEMMTIEGKTIQKQFIKNSSDWIKTSIDVSAIPNGIYLLRITNQRNSITKRLIVK